MVQIPKAVFEHMLDRMIAKHVRPPTKRHRGKKLRESKPVVTSEGLWQEQFLTSKGLPWQVTCQNATREYIQHVSCVCTE